MSACDFHVESHVEYTDHNGTKEFSYNNSNQQVHSNIQSNHLENSYYKVDYPYHWKTAEIESVALNPFSSIELALQSPSYDNWIILFNKKNSNIYVRIKTYGNTKEENSNLRNYLINALEIDALTLTKVFKQRYGFDRITHNQNPAIINGKSGYELIVRTESGEKWYEIHELAFVDQDLIYALDYLDSHELTDQDRLDIKNIIGSFHSKNLKDISK